MVLPARSAGPIFHDARISGKFHGVMAATTPIGLRTTSALAKSSSWMISGCIFTSAKYLSHTPAPNTSSVARAKGFPCSRVRIPPSSSALANNLLAASRRAALRTPSSSFQSIWALAAAPNAASRSASEHSGAWA
jgi:hypothetical protein